MPGLLDLKPRKQETDWDCGAAAVACVYGFFGTNKPVSYFRALLGSNGIDGTDPRAIEAHLRRDGFRVLSGEMEADDLKFHPRRGRPIIAPVTWPGGCGHYVVVRGVQRGKVHLCDPDAGLQAVSVERFLSAWWDADRFTHQFDRFGLAVWR